MAKESTKTIAQNKKAHHDYFVIESFEAGIELCGTEVKSIRQGRVNMKDSWCTVENGELFVKGMHISPYEQGNIFNRDPLRPRKLLLHHREIRKLESQVMRQGFTLIPLEVYFSNGRVKVMLGLCKGKQLHDKRETMAKKDSEREIQRALRQRQK